MEAGKTNTETQVMSTPKTDLTFVLADIMRNLATAQLKAEVLAKELDVKYKHKDTANAIANRCKVSIRDVRHAMSPASLKVIDEEILPAEVFLQVDQITTALYAMPKGIRDEVEDYVMSRYNIYSLNKQS